MIKSEHQEQVSVIQWMRMQYPKITIFAIPNAAKRSPQLASYMKAEGMLAGTSDLFIMKPMGKYHGLFIEMKSAGGKVSPSQKEFIEKANFEGYLAKVCFGFEEAKEVIKNYLQDK